MLSLIEAYLFVQHHLRDRVRLVRISPRKHEKGTCRLRHTSLVTPVAGEHSLLDQRPLAQPRPRWRLPEGPGSGAAGGAASCRSGYGLRLTGLEGLSLRAAAAQLQISPMALSHREVRLAIPLPQKKALAALRQQLVGAG